MNYDEAKALIAQHAPGLLVDDQRDDQRHINVRKTATGAPFSMMLPNLPVPADTPEVPAVPEHIGPEGNTIYATAYVPATVGVEVHKAQETQMFVDSIKAAVAHL